MEQTAWLVDASKSKIHNFQAVAPYKAISNVHFWKIFADEFCKPSSVINSSDELIFKLSFNSPDLSQGIFHHQYFRSLLNGVHQLVVFETSHNFFVGYINYKSYNKLFNFESRSLSIL